MFFLWIALFLAACGDQKEKELLSTFELEPGFQLELVAAEPLIGDPVDMEIDEYGRLYIVEMPGYPLDKTGSGKIKILRDTNGDGRMDESTVFADSLVLPNSIMRWKKGVLVTDSPNVLYLEDTDGDGKADVRDTLLTGFALSNPQHNLNSPVLGIDNWIYLAHEGAVGTTTYKDVFGDPGREIYYPASPDSPRLAINAGGRSVRFRPDTRALEMCSSHTQFGQAFDVWGRHFLVSNANHIFQEVIAETYLRRNRDLLVSNATQSLSDHGDAAEVFPITLNPEHQLLTDVGVITSACGIAVYTGGSFPAEYEGVTFVAEPVSNLVHVDKLTDQGSTFVAGRMSPHREFLASTDSKFRPVNFYVGPDGALYVVDYYRQIIEHPEWMSEEVVESGALYNDIDKGRIYRITRTGSPRAEWTSGLTLGDMPAQQLASQLSNPNSWWRSHAQRLLIDRDDPATVPFIREVLRGGSSVGRLHALWTLAGIDEVREIDILNALQDSVPGVRENAIRISEDHLSDGVIKVLIGLQNDPDGKVRFQLLCTLGSVATPQAEQARLELLFKSTNDKWTQIAALSASSLKASEMLSSLLNRSQETPDGSLIQRLAAMIGANGKEGETDRLITKLTTSSTAESRVAASLLEGIAVGFESTKRNAVLSRQSQQLLITTFFKDASTRTRKAVIRLLKSVDQKDDALLTKAVRQASLIATDLEEKEDKRGDAIDFISLHSPSAYAALLMKLFAPAEPLTVELAALRTLGAIPDTTVSVYLLEHWPALTPVMRDAAIGTFLGKRDRTEMLVSAIENGKISPADISWPRKVRLMAQSDQNLRNRSRVLFTKGDQIEINKEFAAALELKGNATNGQGIYEKNCAICHQVRGKMGIAFGPDLGTIHNWSPTAIMTSILSPNESLSSGFDLWEVETLSGESMQGIIMSETPGAFSVRNPDGLEKLINRAEVKSIKALHLSAMPDDFGTKISAEEMRDLLTFLKENK